MERFVCALKKYAEWIADRTRSGRSARRLRMHYFHSGAKAPRTPPWRCYKIAPAPRPPMQGLCTPNPYPLAASPPPSEHLQEKRNPQNQDQEEAHHKGNKCRVLTVLYNDPILKILLQELISPLHRCTIGPLIVSRLFQHLHVLLQATAPIVRRTSLFLYRNN